LFFATQQQEGKMRITTLLDGNLFGHTIYGERYLNDSKGRFEDYSEVEPKYDPQGPLPIIQLPYTLLPPERCIVLQDEPSLELKEWARIGHKYRFFWHPDVTREEFEICGTVPSQPTSSTRTLLTEEPFRVYIKTDLDKKHFRFIRRLKQSSVEHSIAICSELRSLCGSIAAPSRYSFLPESLGIIAVGGKHEGSGTMYRESKPFPHVEEKRTMMPYHSLYASDPKAPKDLPLLAQLVVLHGNNDKIGYFVSEIIGPILEAWTLLVSKRGLLPELHGQNSLLELDMNLRPKRVVHRDFQGTYSDSQIRTGLGLDLFSKHIVGTEAGTTVQSQYSHVFDGMIGRYLLSRLTKAFCTAFNEDYAYVADAIKAYHRGIPEWRVADFPPTTYRFGNTAKEQAGNEVTLIDTGILPEFR
jgi:siderophore synthetase component